MTSIKIHFKLELEKTPKMDILVECFDGYATFHSTYKPFTKDLAKTASPGEEAVYSERLQKTIVKYPGKTQEEIVEKVKAEIEGLQ